MAIFSTCSDGRGPFFNRREHRRSGGIDALKARGGIRSTPGWKPRRCSSIGERLAFQELHHQEVGPIMVADVVQHADMRMLELRDDFGFAFESGAQVGASHQLRVQDLDRNRAVQSCVAGAIDLAHATGAERRFDFVGTKSRARG